MNIMPFLLVIIHVAYMPSMILHVENNEDEDEDEDVTSQAFLQTKINAQICQNCAFL